MNIKDIKLEMRYIDYLHDYVWMGLYNSKEVQIATVDFASEHGGVERILNKLNDMNLLKDMFTEPSVQSYDEYKEDNNILLKDRYLIIKGKKYEVTKVVGEEIYYYNEDGVEQTVNFKDIV